MFTNLSVCVTTVNYKVVQLWGLILQEVRLWIIDIQSLASLDVQLCFQCVDLDKDKDKGFSKNSCTLRCRMELYFYIRHNCDGSVASCTRVAALYHKEII